MGKEVLHNEGLYSKERPLKGKTIAIVGAGPAGSIMACLLGREGVNVLLFDHRDHSRPDVGGIGPCTGCAGIIQLSAMDQLENVELPLPREIIQENLSGFVVYTPDGEKTLEIPVEMASVYRGWGPVGGEETTPSFDAWLFGRAEKLATVRAYKKRVAKITLGNQNNLAKIETADGKTFEANFVIGAFGHSKVPILNPDETTALLDLPVIKKAVVREYLLGREFVEETYRGKVHVVGNPTKNVWFAALVPKDKYVSAVIMGRGDVTPEDFEEFLETQVAKKLLPDNLKNKFRCGCSRNTITIASPRRFVILGEGGIVLTGDAGPTRIRKNGIGAAIDLAWHLSQTLINEGYQGAALRKFEAYAWKNYVVDNFFAGALLRVNDLVLNNPSLTSLIFKLANEESSISPVVRKHMELMLTGEIPYWQVFPKAWLEFFR